MPRDGLSARERAAMFALLGVARKVSNPELRELAGFTLDGKERRNLNDRKLVESEKQGRAFAHELSDKGWRWCADELAVSAPAQASSVERAHYLVFGMFARYLSANRLSLADIASVRPDLRDGADADVSVDLTVRVAEGYHALAPADGAFVKLRELRARLDDIPRRELDAALIKLFEDQRINLIPQSNQQALSDADRSSALGVGGEYKHLISIERQG